MPNFNTADGELSGLFITDTDILDRYVGNQLWAWGRNAYGQIGDNTTIHRSSPVQTISNVTSWKLTTGGSHSASIKTDNSLWVWGNNNWGEVGDNTQINKASPVQTVSVGTNWYQVSCGNQHTVAIKTDGSLWTWGGRLSPNYGVIGDNTSINKSSPVQTIAQGTNWKLVASGVYHVTAIKTNGTLWLWGHNSYGQLGDNSSSHRSSPVQTVSAVGTWLKSSGGNTFSAAIKTDGTLWTWGSNAYGQLGDNTVISKSSPIQTISTGTNWKSVACGSRCISALKNDGSLWSWGHNSYGSLGNNSTAHRSSPVQTVSTGNNWKTVANNVFTTVAIKTDGTLWSWGRNTFGQIGDNTIIHKSSPTQTVAGGTNWKQVIAGSQHTVAITYTES